MSEGPASDPNQVPAGSWDADAPRFGIAISTSAHPGADPVAGARQAEELGFDLLTVSDHLHGTHPTFETWTLLTWVAAATSTIHIAPLVLGLPYRNPPVVAKMAESLHRLSAGRLILGLGGGGSDDEFRAFGLTVRPPRDKVEALAEEVELLRGLWTERPFTFQGRHFHTQDAQVEPKPDTRIPIWLGTYGPRSLAMTGRLADGWNPSYPYAPPPRIIEMRDRVRRGAEQAGRDPDILTYAYNVTVRVDPDAPADPRSIAGGPAQVAARLVELIQLGMRTLVFWARGGSVQRELLATQVLPRVREATG